MIDWNEHDVSLSPDTKDDQSWLCENWPAIRTGLERMSNIPKNPAATWIIIGVLALGDVIIRKICGS